MQRQNFDRNISPVSRQTAPDATAPGGAGEPEATLSGSARATPKQQLRRVMTLIINGEQRECVADSLAGLLEELGLDGEAVVAERNGIIVQRGDFVATLLLDGDRIELVRFVGGG